MKKRIDWKRVGWTALSDFIITGLGCLIVGATLNGWRYIGWNWLVLFMLFFLHDLITRRDFYYHNGDNSQC